MKLPWYFPVATIDSLIHLLRKTQEIAVVSYLFKRFLGIFAIELFTCCLDADAVEFHGNQWSYCWRILNTEGILESNQDGPHWFFIIESCAVLLIQLPLGMNWIIKPMTSLERIKAALMRANLIGLDSSNTYYKGPVENLMLNDKTVISSVVCFFVQTFFYAQSLLRAYHPIR